METEDPPSASSRSVNGQATIDLAAASRRLLDGCSAEESTPLRALRRAVAAVERSTVTVAFGGHFKAGKSSLVNALLGRAILPVKDRPETGVACHLRSGEADRCSAETVEGLVEVPCTTAGIASVSTLLDERGETRKTLATIRRIQLTLEGAPLEPNLVWIDPPGLNDVQEMDVRLREAAEEADVLVWVLNSQQLLSEAEQAFLADYVATHGANALVFVVHVFLQQNPEAEWNRFLSQSATQLLNKIHSFAREAGGQKGQETPILIASAVGMQMDFAQYGGTALRELLGGSNELRELVRKARHERLSLAIRESFDRVEERAGGERERLAKARAEREQAQAAAEYRIGDYRTAVQRLLRGFVSLFTVEVRRISGTMAGATKPGMLKPDGAYGRELTNDLRTLAAQLLASLDKDLQAAARSAGVPQPSASAMQAVNAQFAIPDLVAPVPPLAQTEKMATAKMIVKTGWVTILVFCIGCAILPIGWFMMALAGLDTHQKRKVQNDQLQATCHGISAAAEWVIGTLGSREVVVLKLLVEAARETVPELVVDSQVQRLLEISDTLAHLRTAAEPRAIPT